MRIPHRLTVFTLADGSTITTRSALEARWTIFFNELGLKWEYEPKRLQFRGGFYTPDFKVEGLGFVEIKPTLNLLIAESSKRIQKAAHAFPVEHIYAFCGERVSFDVMALYHGRSIFAPSNRNMTYIICGALHKTNFREVDLHIGVSMNRANRARLDHFASVGKVLELETIPELARQ